MNTESVEETVEDIEHTEFVEGTVKDTDSVETVYTLLADAKLWLPPRRRGLTDLLLA